MNGEAVPYMSKEGVTMNSTNSVSYTHLGFRGEKCFFFVRALCPDGGGLVLCGLVLPLAPLPLTGCGWASFCVGLVLLKNKTESYYGSLS